MSKTGYPHRRAQREQPRGPTPTATGGQPPSHRGDRKCQAEKQLRVAGNRFAREYQKTIARATGDNAKQSGPSMKATPTNATDETTTTAVASPRVITPPGSSRLASEG